MTYLKFHQRDPVDIDRIQPVFVPRDLVGSVAPTDVVLFRTEGNKWIQGSRIKVLAFGTVHDVDVVENINTVLKRLA